MKTYLEHGNAKDKKGSSDMKRRVVFIFAAVLIIVALGATPVHAESTGTYIVQPGDTLLSIAARHGVSVSQLARANGLRWNSWVYVGQRLIIPGPQPGPGTVYIVQRGDTLFSIAHRSGTTVQEIMRANGLRSTRIYAGQRLIIPGSQPGPVTVDGWVGTIVQLPPGSQHKDYFERNDGQRFGIEGANDTVGEQIREYRWTGAQVRVWGQLHTNVPSYAGRNIQVERIEAVSGPAVEARNLSPFASPSASSVFPSDRGGTYHAFSVIDGALSTPWVEGVAGPGVGEWIMLTFPGTIEVFGIGLDVGYDRDEDIFYANNRIKRVALIFSNGEQIEVTLSDTRGVQMIHLARAPGPNVETTFVKVVIEEVYPGSRYDDTCLAEIEVWGRPK